MRDDDYLTSEWLMGFSPSLRLHQWNGLANPRASTGLKGRQAASWRAVWCSRQSPCSCDDCPVATAQSLLRRWVKGQHNTTVPSIFEHNKNLNETTHKGRQHCELSHLLSLSIPKGFLFLPKVWLRRQRVCPNIFVQGKQNPRFWHRNRSFHCHA